MSTHRIRDRTIRAIRAQLPEIRAKLPDQVLLIWPGTGTHLLAFDDDAGRLAGVTNGVVSQRRGPDGTWYSLASVSWATSEAAVKALRAAGHDVTLLGHAKQGQSDTDAAHEAVAAAGAAQTAQPVLG